MEDRREHPRTKVVKGITLFYNNGNKSLPCVMMDRSVSGAKIQFGAGEVFECPETFKLKYLDVDEIHECRRMWSNKNTIGFQFI